MNVTQRLVAWGLATAACAASTTLHADGIVEKVKMNRTIHVTGQFRSVNGVTEVPIGLFGVHATRLTREQFADWGIESERIIEINPRGQPRRADHVKMLVECFYDRYQPALVLTDPQWKTHLEQLARTYAANARSSGRTHHIEFWNEPFLNWATRPGVNYDARFYESANRVEGAPMTIKGWSKPLDSLVWSKQLRLVDLNTGDVDYLANGDPALQRLGLREGELYQFRGRTLRMQRVWWGRDPGQVSYWSGPQNSQFYRWMLVPFGRALKETNPEVQLIAGWGFHISADRWRAWDILFRPMIDEAIQWIDAIGEHHYGGNTRQVAADYEAAYTYALARYGKRLKFYNTEAGGQLDPQRPDTPAQPRWTGSSIEEARAAFTYLVRDILHLVDKCPDKAVARAQHEAHLNYGVELGFRFLKDLRGRLIYVTAASPNVWGVASLAGQRLCVIIFNDLAQAVDVPLQVTPPEGMSVVNGQCTQLVGDGDRLALRTTAAAAPPPTVRVAARSAVKWVGELRGSPPSGPVVVETQYVADQVRMNVGPNTPAELVIAVPAEALQRAREARLRVVTDCAQPVVQLNGQPVPLDEPVYGINDVPVALQSLATVNRVILNSPTECMTWTASLLLTE